MQPAPDPLHSHPAAPQPAHAHTRAPHSLLFSGAPVRLAAAAAAVLALWAAVAWALAL